MLVLINSMRRATLKLYKRILSKWYKWRVIKVCASFQEPLKVNNKTIVNPETYLGTNVNFNGMSIYGKGKVTIGDNFHSGRNCVIYTQSHNYDFGMSIPYDSSFIYYQIEIGDNVWIGDNVTIVGNVRISEGAIIQTGAVVSRDIPSCALAGGNPAEVFKYRDKDHYLKLKSQGKFL